MLILTRRANEAIKIGDNVTISVLAIRGNQVRLGIEAPREVSVHRQEIFDRIQAEKNSDEEGSVESLEDDPAQETSASGDDDYQMVSGVKVRYLRNV